MAKVNFTGTKAQKNIKPEAIVITEYAAADTDFGTGDSYVLEDVVEDTTSIAQDDNETTDIECETSDTPIISIVKLGKYQFSAEVADTQADLLKALMGYKAVGSKLVAPSTYSKKYVSVAIVFPDSTNADNKIAYVLPKLQLNSKITIESLNSNLARIGLAGTAQLASVGEGQEALKAPFYVDTAYTMPA